ASPLPPPYPTLHCLHHFLNPLPFSNSEVKIMSHHDVALSPRSHLPPSSPRLVFSPPVVAPTPTHFSPSLGATGSFLPKLGVEGYVNEFLIPETLLGLNNSYLESLVPLGTSEKMDCSDDKLVADLMNTNDIKDYGFVAEDFVEDVAEDVTNSEADLVHRDEAVVKLIHRVFGNINNALNVIKKWKESTNDTWVHL
ncbi:hypothetical protein KI387_016560, partial [Taxus chinensis]